MISLKTFVLFIVAISLQVTSLHAQQMEVINGEATVPNLSSLRYAEGLGPRVVQYRGTLKDSTGRPLRGVVGVLTAVYKDREGGTPLWSETQNVQLDAQGNYTMLLGATTVEGIPPEVFSSSEPRWLGMQTLVPDSEEQPRLMFVSVPYALKAADSDTLGGRPASAYVLADSVGGKGSSPESAKDTKSNSSIDTNTSVSAIVNPGTSGHLSKYVNSTDVGDAVATEDGSGNMITTGSYTGAAHWLNGFGSGLNSNGFAMSAPNTVIFATKAQNSLTIDPNANVTALGSFTGAAHWLNGFGSAPNANGFAMSAPNTLLFSSNAQPRMTISSAGDIGIGTTSPAAKLDVSGTAKATAFSMPTTTGASTGVLTFGGNRFLHNFGTSNTFLGTNAGNFTMTASFNTATGENALSGNTTGTSNTASGANTLLSNTIGSFNTAIGTAALSNNTTGAGNTASGVAALDFNTTGGNNTATGFSALELNTTGFNNTATGSLALAANTEGLVNTASGFTSLRSNTTGSSNTAIGTFALQDNTVGNNNTAIGRGAGLTGTAANANTTGSNNTFIGYQAGPGTSTQLTNATAIGANALVSASNALILGDSAVSVGIGTQAPLDKLDVNGDIRVGTGMTGCVKDHDGTAIAGTCSSDARLKQNIEPFKPLLEKLVQIQPVHFYWKSEEYPQFKFGQSRSFGLVAQDVEKVLPEIVTEDEHGFKAVNYSQLPFLLLQALRELKAENDSLRQKIQSQTLQFRTELEAIRTLLEEFRNQQR